MKDTHIHLQGEYTIENINKIVKKAVEMELDEIWLLDHTYYFKDFALMYEAVCKDNEKNRKWFNRKNDTLNIEEYWKLITEVRKKEYPIKIKFGLEVCYFKEFENLIKENSEKFDYDFLIGSIHFIGDMQFGRFKDEWEKYNVDELYKKYFEASEELVKSRIFNVIAHPDSIKQHGHKPSFNLKPYYEKLVKEIIKNPILLEQNSGVIRRTETKDLGMNNELLQMAIDKNIQITTSSDAHEIRDIGYMVKRMLEEIEDRRSRGNSKCTY